MQRIFIICRFQCAPETRYGFFAAYRLARVYMAGRIRVNVESAIGHRLTRAVLEMRARARTARCARVDKIRNYFLLNAEMSHVGNVFSPILPLPPPRPAPLSVIAFIFDRPKYTKCQSEGGKAWKARDAKETK